jgi:hypothetical protein
VKAGPAEDSNCKPGDCVPAHAARRLPPALWQIEQGSRRSHPGRRICGNVAHPLARWPIVENTRGVGPLSVDFCCELDFGSWAQTPGERRKNLRVPSAAHRLPGQATGPSLPNLSNLDSRPIRAPARACLAKTHRRTLVSPSPRRLSETDTGSRLRITGVRLLQVLPAQCPAFPGRYRMHAGIPALGPAHMQSPGAQTGSA